MPITPDLPFPKSAGDAIRSKDWNDLVVESQRLDNAKVNRSGDTISGNLSVGGSLAVKTNTPKAPLHVEGAALISDGGGFAVPNNHMQSGSLTIGSVTKNFGGGTDWNANTAGLLLETLNDTEIAVHDSGTRIASVVRYESATNSLTIGRDMGWNAINRVIVNGRLGVGVENPGFLMDVNNRIRLRQGTDGTAGIFLYQNTPNEDRAFVGMADDNHVGLWGNKGAGWALKTNVTTGNTGIKSNPSSNYALHVNGNSFTNGRAKDNKIQAWVSKNNKVTTSSTSWVDVPNMALTINLPVASNVLILAQICGVQTQMTGQPLDNKRPSYFRILVDNSEVQKTRDEFHNSGWELRGIHMSEIKALNAGTHTIKLQWHTGGASLLTCCWYGDKRQIQVIELS